ncbi:hypothetical protein [Streptomyces sp. NPDC059378]|uniref:hypothetical protein n=1 Tax=Streptomyces sp. NPDC059378 TaxID=3346815 RepID=UPI003689CA4B
MDETKQLIVRSPAGGVVHENGRGPRTSGLGPPVGGSGAGQEAAPAGHVGAVLTWFGHVGAARRRSPCRRAAGRSGRRRDGGGPEQLGPARLQGLGCLEEGGLVGVVSEYEKPLGVGQVCPGSTEPDKDGTACCCPLADVGLRLTVCRASLGLPGGLLASFQVGQSSLPGIALLLNELSQVVGFAEAQLLDQPAYCGPLALLFLAGQQPV